MGNTACGGEFHDPLTCLPKTIRTPVVPQDTVPVTGAPSGSKPPWPDNSLHIMYSTNKAGTQMTAIRFHGDRWPWLIHAINYLEERNTGCIAKFD